MPADRKQDLLKGTSPGKGSLLEKAKRIFGAGRAPQGAPPANEKEEIAAYHDGLAEERSGRSPAKPGGEASLYAKPDAGIGAEKTRPAADQAAEGAKKGGSGGKDKKFSLSGITGFAKDKPWQGQKLIKTNLIQSEVVSFLDWSGRVKMLIIAVAVPLGLTLAAFVGLTVWDIKARTEAETLGGEIDSLSKRIDQAESNVESVDLFKNKLVLVDKLLDMHIHWTNLFAFMEENILSDSTIMGGFSGQLDGHYSFSIIGTSYNDVIKQLNVLREEELVDSASIKQASLSAGKDAASVSGVSYSLELKLNPNIFLKQNTDNERE